MLIIILSGQANHLGYIEQYFKEEDKMEDWHFQMFCLTVGQPIFKRLWSGVMLQTPTGAH
jgi:hypothetical protein